MKLQIMSKALACNSVTGSTWAQIPYMISSNKLIFEFEFDFENVLSTCSNCCP